LLSGKSNSLLRHKFNDAVLSLSNDATTYFLTTILFDPVYLASHSQLGLLTWVLSIRFNH